MTPAITCPYCGTTTFELRSNCVNCGAALPPPASAPSLPALQPASRAGSAAASAVADPAASAEAAPDVGVYARSAPPMAPRRVPRGYLMRRLGPDAGAIVGLTFFIMGVTFLPLGITLALASGGGVIGWIFIPLGTLFFVGGGGLLAARVSAARRRMAVLRDGQPALGRITTISQDRHVEVNGRLPWVIAYRFSVLGREFGGKVTTLRDPDADLRPGAPVYVLYDPNRPEENTLYLDL